MPVRASAVQTVVQDVAGAAARLAVYNAEVSARPDSLLPEEALLAIKEPFFISAANGSPGIRVDHPSDLIRLSPFNPQVPRELLADPKEVEKAAAAWKEEGNAAFQADDYLTAVHAYSHGITSGLGDMMTRRDLLRNRALANILLGRFEQALADSKAAVNPDSDSGDGRAVALNVKAYNRAGRAAYLLHKWQESESYFKRAVELAPENQEASLALEHIQHRRREETCGDYDFVRMSKSTSKRYNRIDHANFTSNTTIHDAGERGRGLFATKDILSGQLIMCEKALCIAFDSDEASHTYTILDSNKQQASAGTQAALMFSLVHNLAYNRELAIDFNKLNGGGTRHEAPPRTVDGLVTINAFHARMIIANNCYGCPTVKSSSRTAQKQAASSTGYPSTGLWLRASYINHACDGNAMRSFIGDMMIVRATRNIKKGDEIVMPYRLPHAINAVTQDELFKTWGFKCGCGICSVEAASPYSQRKSRGELFQKMSALLAANPLSEGQHRNAASIERVEKLSARLRNTYDEPRFENRPRLALVAPGLWLCEAYKRRGSTDQTREAAVALLRDLGFVVNVAGQTVQVDRRHCQLEARAIDAATCAAGALYDQGNKSIGNQMEEFARSLYLTMHGEMGGFEERLPKS